MPRHLTTSDTSSFVTTTQLGAASGVATLGSDGKVPNSQLPAVATGSVDSVNGQVGNVVLTAANVDAVATTDVGVSNGVAQLDSTGHLVAAQVPTNLLTSAQLGAANGIATLDSSGKLPSAQFNAPVTSVNTKTGAVTLTASDVSAIATSARGAASGVASLDSNTLVPLAQIPSLTSLYQQVPGSTATAPGQYMTAVAAGSNSTAWTNPLVYVAASSGTMPTAPVSGTLCVRTDVHILYSYIGSTWVALPYEEPWRNLTFPSGSGVRGYNNNDPNWFPQVRRMGSHVHIRGRMELTAGGNFTVTSGFAILTLPSDCVPSRGIDLDGTSTTGSGQPGFARFQIDASNSQVKLWLGTGPNPATAWVGIQGSYWVD